MQSMTGLIKPFQEKPERFFRKHIRRSSKTLSWVTNGFVGMTSETYFPSSTSKKEAQLHCFRKSPPRQRLICVEIDKRLLKVVATDRVICVIWSQMRTSSVHQLLSKRMLWLSISRFDKNNTLGTLMYEIIHFAWRWNVILHWIH